MLTNTPVRSAAPPRRHAGQAVGPIGMKTLLALDAPRRDATLRRHATPRRRRLFPARIIPLPSEPK